MQVNNLGQSMLPWCNYMYPSLSITALRNGALKNQGPNISLAIAVNDGMPLNKVGLQLGASSNMARIK